MKLPTASAEKELLRRYGAPAKSPTKYVVGFTTMTGRVLALDKAAADARIWFQPPKPPSLAGVFLMPSSAKNSNLNGALSLLNSPDTLRIEIDSGPALHRFLDWYEGVVNSTVVSSDTDVDLQSFRVAFGNFQQLLKLKDKGHAFTNFQEGLAAAWESYKPRLREHALGILRAEQWSEGDIGSGRILQNVIAAIEIQDHHANLTNNLVFWQNRFGHTNRDHRVLLEGLSKPKLRKDLEGLFFGLFRGTASEAVTFDQLRDVTSAKYPLLAYLYFLKDMDRFMPIQPTGFDRAFRECGIEFTTLRQCSWTNYSSFNSVLVKIQSALQTVTGLPNIRLIDAHSFCWIFATLLKLEAEGSLSNVNAKIGAGKDPGRVIGGRQKSIIAMRLSIENTTKNSNGQTVQRTLKNKNLGMSSLDLEKHIELLLDVQGNRCALTGIPFHFHGPDADKKLLPSPDRIDSDGHYEVGNIQIVCQFINGWKSDTADEEFRRLLALVRREES